MEIISMSKKVLILSASPRKGGNSNLLCDQFMLGAEETGNQAEKIFLRDKTINYCTGCGTCLNRGESCPQKDDMPEVLEKMIAADVIVMATPVYFYTMNGQMKTLIDRTCSRYTEINDKEFYFIATAADDNKQAMERTFEGFRGFTSCLEGANEKGVIYGTGAWNIGDIKGSKAMEQAYEMGKAV
jgi:multimeric flavodoxin WrbA